MYQFICVQYVKKAFVGMSQLKRRLLKQQLVFAHQVVEALGNDPLPCGGRVVYCPGWLGGWVVGWVVVRLYVLGEGGLQSVHGTPNL